MELNVRALLGEICPPDELERAEALARELTQLARDHRVKLTPIVLVRLEEFLMLYYTVQGIEADLRETGLYVADTKSTIVSPAKAPKGQQAADNPGVNEEPGEPAAPKVATTGVPKRLHPNIEHAAKVRERLNKSIKELETVLKVEGNAGPTSIAELLADLKDEYEQEERMNATG